METATEFIFLGLKITADDNCSHEIRSYLLLGRKVMTNLDRILKSKDITLLPKVHIVKAMVFLVVVYECESWTKMKVEHQRIGAFELWCWRRLLWVPSTARRSNQSILKETSPEYSLEGLMLKLKLHYFGHLMRRTDSLEKILILGKNEGRRRRGRQRMGWLDGITNSTDMSFSRLQELVMDRETCLAAVHGVAKSRTQLRVWTELDWSCVLTPWTSLGLCVGSSCSLMAARSPGILLLSECPGGLESLMTVTPLSIDMAGNTPFLITNPKAFQTLSLMVHLRCMND